jgi:uncharacterized membrane protein
MSRTVPHLVPRAGVVVAVVLLVALGFVLIATGHDTAGLVVVLLPFALLVVLFVVEAVVARSETTRQQRRTGGGSW